MTPLARRLSLPLPLLAAACTCGEGPPSPPPEVALEIDGMRVLASEIAPLCEYLDAVDRHLGRNAKIAAVLDYHVLPLRLAQRAFAAQRRPLLESCTALRRAVDNGAYPALVAKAGRVRGATALSVLRTELPLSLASWVFAADSIGQVSPVLETPQGFCLVGVWQVEAGATRTADRAEVFQVPFFTHAPDEFDAWLRREKAAVAGRLSYVHPDYADALPPWLQLPPTAR